ncbi:hypothetical protein HMPREF9374_1891 [Desmospora sp. 8437]|nr:hypothetical protein HMPREF9374_1891 [Desmospora sp. 8437]
MSHGSFQELSVCQYCMSAFQTDTDWTNQEYLCYPVDRNSNGGRVIPAAG